MVETTRRQCLVVSTASYQNNNRRTRARTLGSHIRASQPASNMKSSVLVLSLLVQVFCHLLETAAQNDSVTIISSSTPMDPVNVTMSLTISSDNETPNMSLTISTMEVTSSNFITVPVVTFSDMPSGAPFTSMAVVTFSDMPSDGVSATAPLIPTLMTSPLSVKSNFIISTIVMTSPVNMIDTSSTMVVTTTTTVTSGVMPMITTIMVTSSNPVPVPSDSKTNDISMELIIVIAVVGGITLLVILLIVICCGYCYCHRKRDHYDDYVLSPTIQTRSFGYDRPPSRNPSIETYPRDAAKFVVLANPITHTKENLIYQTPL